MKRGVFFVLLLSTAMLWLSCGRIEGPDFTDMPSPRVIVNTPASPASGNILVTFQVMDVEKDQISVQLEYSLDNGISFSVASLADASEALNLDSDHFPGIGHTVRWDSVADGVGLSDCRSVIIRVNPSDTQGSGTSDNTGSFIVNNISFNQAPAVTVTTPSGPVMGSVRFSYTLLDAESNYCSITAQYSIGNSGSWLPATAAPVGDGAVGLTSSPSGVEHSFWWDSVSDNIAISAPETVYLRITPRDFSEGNSAITESFVLNNTGSTLPPTVEIVSGPDNGSTVTTKKVTFQWQGSDPENGSLTYYYSFDHDPPNIETNATSVESDILESGYHTFRIVAIDNEGSLSETASRIFYVDYSFHLPDCASNPFPANRDENIPITTTLSWESANHANGYLIHFGTTENPPYVGENSGETSYNLDVLLHDTTYFWKVIPYNQYGNANNIAIWSFCTIGPPEAVSGPNPPDLTSGVSLNPTLSWAPANSATSYDVYYGVEPTITTVDYRENVSGNSCATFHLDYNTTYYWRIDSKNEAGTTVGTIWSFRTINAQSGALLWAEPLRGDNSYDWSYDLVTLSDDSFIVTGLFDDLYMIFGLGQENETMLESEEIALYFARYSKGGSLIWARSVVGEGETHSYAITNLSDDSFVITGRFNKNVTFGVGEENETLLSGGPFFIARYNKKGDLLWAKQAAANQGTALTTLSDDSIVITGVFSGTVTFGLGEDNQTDISAYSSNDIFIARYNASGSLQWVKSAGKMNDETGTGLIAFKDDSFGITGYFKSSVIFGQGEENETEFGGKIAQTDIFVARYNPSGTLHWARKAGGTEYDKSYAITSFSDDSIAITGFFSSNATFGLGQENEKTLTSINNTDVFIAKYSIEGELVWVKQACAELARSITALSDDSFAITGRYGPPATFGIGEENETLLESWDANDIFIALYSSNGLLTWAKRAGFNSFDEGMAISAFSDDSIIVTGRYSDEAIFGISEENEIVLPHGYSRDVFIARYKK